MAGRLNIMTVARTLPDSFETRDPGAIASEPFAPAGRNWTRWAGMLLSASILICVAHRLRATDYRALIALLPVNPAFWIAFAGYYLAAPLSEWIVFRRLWGLPARGMEALLRKLVSNELLLGYLGEVYFYTWARRNAGHAAAPFGAIKDVAILSALAGNGFTLFLLMLALPSLGSLHIGMAGSTFAISAAVILLSSMMAMAFRKRVFTLSRQDLRFVAAAHMLRIITMTALAALMWHLLLPGIAVAWLLLLATMRQLLSRLPLIPNKDVVFAGLAASLVGMKLPIVAAVTLVASLILAMHLVVGIGLGIAEIAGQNRQ